MEKSRMLYLDKSYFFFYIKQKTKTTEKPHNKTTEKSQTNPTTNQPKKLNSILKKLSVKWTVSEMNQHSNREVISVR